MIEPVEIPPVGTTPVEIIDALRRSGRTIAVAESLTGGLLVAELISVPGASSVVRGGVVAYATDLKASLLGVDSALLDAVGPIHPDVAQQMAAGVRARPPLRSGHAPDPSLPVMVWREVGLAGER